MFVYIAAIHTFVKPISWRFSLASNRRIKYELESKTWVKFYTFCGGSGLEGREPSSDLLLPPSLLADHQETRFAPCAVVPTPSPSGKIFRIGSYSLITSRGHCVFIFASRNPKVCLYFLRIIFSTAIKGKEYQSSSNEKSCLSEVISENIQGTPIFLNTHFHF